jgi:hypothetical protein
MKALDRFEGGTILHITLQPEYDYIGDELVWTIGLARGRWRSSSAHGLCP